jgi:hypothetical protein
MGKGIKRKCLAGLGVLLVCAMAMRTQAATNTVTNTNDSGRGSLRQALSIANNGDMITFAVTGTIVLTSGGLVIDKDVTISGPGADQLSINGNQTQQCVLYADQTTVTISHLTITNGAAICNDHGALTVDNCIITGNSYGGIANDGVNGPQVRRSNGVRDVTKPYDQCFAAACLTVTNSTISGNSGPGIDNVSAAVTIVNSTLTDNSTGQEQGFGGGVNTHGIKAPGLATIINSTISGNSAFYGGGGISCGFSSLTVAGSTISGNSTGGVGGGIAGGDFATIVNSTISENSAGTSGGGIASGGHTAIANTTITDNSAASGGGIYNGQQSALEIYNTILNAGASGENIFNDSGTVASQGYNLSSDDGGGYLNGLGDQINTDPLLGPLQDNGGPTLTHALLPGSPAINAGDPNFTPPPYYDQRGPLFRRVFNRRIDIGSFETQPTPPPFPRPRPTPPR